MHVERAHGKAGLGHGHGHGHGHGLTQNSVKCLFQWRTEAKHSLELLHTVE